MLSAAFVELNWKNVVTLKIYHDNLMLWSFSNSTGSIAESFMQALFLSLGIKFVLKWPLTLRLLLMLLRDLKPCTRVINIISNARNLKKNNKGEYFVGIQTCMVTYNL